MARKSCKFGVKKGGCRKRPRGGKKGVSRGGKCPYGKVKRGPRKGRCRKSRRTKR